MSVHAVAIIKGAIEGDPTRYFASLLGWEQHLAVAVDAGLVERGEDPYGVIPTTAGREFYAQHGLAEFPDGRANAWDSRAQAAVAELVSDTRPHTERLGGVN